MKFTKTPRISDPRHETAIDIFTITNSSTCKNKNRTGNLSNINGPKVMVRNFLVHYLSHLYGDLFSKKFFRFSP